MGAEPWDYFVPYEANIQSALDRLREREFRAGRFRGSEMRPVSIEDAVIAMDADGTASILDIDHVADEPEFCAVAPVPADRLIEHFGTDRPTREMVEQGEDLFEDIERGQGVYIVVYKDGAPSELYFAGYSFD
jgi:hypothetical protein